jgi:RNA polymerase sigma factor (sigma-70 family)
MSGPAWNNVLQRVRGLVRPADGGLTDAQLVSRWLASRDEAAFELLVWRHGPTVRGVCQRLLRSPQDVEDAFQATFLVFLRKAGGIGKREAVGSWLYKVAYRVALQARSRPAPERLLDGLDVLIPAPPAADALAWRDVRLVLDEEVNRLPARYRSVFILRCLQGRTDEETARELGVPAGTVQSRLSRARARLRSRLTRRGVTLTAAAVGTGWAAEASAVVPASLVRVTVRAALSGAADQAAAGVVTAQAAALAKGALHAMWMTKVKMTAALVVSLALLGGGAFTYRTLAAGPGDEPSRVGKADDGKQDPLKDLKAENQRLKAMLDEAKAREQALQDEAARQRDLAAKSQADINALTRRVGELEAKLAWTEKNGGRAPGGSSSGPPVAETNKLPFGAVSPGTVQAARDEVELMLAQLQVKKAELQGAMIDLRAAERSHTRVQALAKSAAVSSEEVGASEDKVARAKAAVDVKEAELREQEVRLQQAMRRVDQLQPAKEAPKAAPPAIDPKQIQEIRQELERLMRKVEALEKGSKSPPPGTSRP